MAELDGQSGGLEAAMAEVLNLDGFDRPGETLDVQLEAVATAIADINYGQQQALLDALAGTQGGDNGSKKE